MPTFNNKKVLISPYTKSSDAFREKFLKEFKSSIFLGFIDKVQVGNDIYKIDEVSSLDFDYILILSPNHFDSIYYDYKILVKKKKIVRVDITNNSYQYLFLKHIKTDYSKLLKNKLLKTTATLFDKLSYKRAYLVFISKKFITGNNKFLYIYAQNNNIKSVMLTSNKEQYLVLKKLGYKVYLLDTFFAYFYFSLAKYLIVDQGDNSPLLNIISSNQKSIQQWHGIPLEHMNLLVDIKYDYFISTSEFVSKTSFSKVFLANEFISCGYARNDVFLKQKHEEEDLIFTDLKVYNFVKKIYKSDKKVIVYMPTFRESDLGKKQSQFTSMALEFDSFNKQLRKIQSYMIIKLHPFVMVFYKDLIKSFDYTNIIFHNIQGDIYPILKYCDILITDYSSVYADFLLLNRPIIFFLYDHGSCSKTAHGYIYEFDDVSPGEKAYTQEDLIESIKKINLGEDDFKEERQSLRNKFFEYKDEYSARRLIEVLNK